jgi:hypothetical protein
MNFNIRKFSYLIIAILFITILGFDSTKVKAVEKKFTVKIVDNERQKVPKLPYFHFEGTPGETYKVEFIIRNVTDKPLNLVVKVANGFSNPYANLNYTIEDETYLSQFLDENRKFSKYVTGENYISMQSKEQKNVSFDISLPNEMTTGEMIGAFIIEENEKMSSVTDNSGSEQSGASLKSRINYVVSTLIELPQKIDAVMEFGSVEFKADSTYPKIEVEILNKFPKFLKESTLDYKITNKNNKIVFEGSKEILRFSPSTNIIVPINFEGKKISPADYNLEMTYSSNNKEFKTITYKTVFEVKLEQLKAFKEKQGEGSIIPVIDLYGWKIYIIFGFVASLFAALGYYLPKFLKRRKKVE